MGALVSLSASLQMLPTGAAAHMQLLSPHLRGSRHSDTAPLWLRATPAWLAGGWLAASPAGSALAADTTKSCAAAAAVASRRSVMMEAVRCEAHQAGLHAAGSAGTATRSRPARGSRSAQPPHWSINILSRAAAATSRCTMPRQMSPRSRYGASQLLHWQTIQQVVR